MSDTRRTEAPSESEHAPSPDGIPESEDCAHPVTEMRAAYTYDTIHCLCCGKQIGIY